MDSSGICSSFKIKVDANGSGIIDIKDPFECYQEYKASLSGTLSATIIEGGNVNFKGEMNLKAGLDDRLIDTFSFDFNLND